MKDIRIQIKETLLERLIKAAARESIKKNEPITPAEYVRRVLAKHLKRRENYNE